ncbi:hypothetical protein [Roseomonas chloroacetimidivorans]|uniref:hypothetical protein n=1 Tax=Roseomonas chloroacetimidivorans TaxID=1766656 RepID=UPI003C75C0CC
MSCPPRSATPNQELQALAHSGDLQELLARWTKLDLNGRDMVLMLIRAMVEAKRQ